MSELDKKRRSKVPLVIIDLELNKLQHVVLFPEKVEKAKQATVRLGLPTKRAKNYAK